MTKLWCEMFRNGKKLTEISLPEITVTFNEVEEQIESDCDDVFIDDITVTKSFIRTRNNMKQNSRNNTKNKNKSLKAKDLEDKISEYLPYKSVSFCCRAFARRCSRKYVLLKVAHKKIGKHLC